MASEKDIKGDSSPDDRSLGDRGRDLLKGAGHRVQSVTETLSGKNIEQLVAEYSEQFTQVLLGLHKDLEAQGRNLQEQTSRIESLERQVSSMRIVRIIAVAALTIAMVSAGVALWAAL